MPPILGPKSSNPTAARQYLAARCPAIKTDDTGGDDEIVLMISRPAVVNGEKPHWFYSSGAKRPFQTRIARYADWLDCW